MLETRTLAVSIDRDWCTVYDFACIPENFPRWASGLGGLDHSDTGWIARTPEGIAMPVRFAPRNAHGVLDHWLTPPEGDEIYLPLRVIANGAGCTVMLTLLRRPGTTDAAFAADADWVARDLARLKELMET